MIWYAAFFLTLCPVALCRFDLVPALLGFLAATCWFGNRPRWGGGLAALGTLVKLFPAAVAVPGMAVDLRERSWSRWGLTTFLPTLLVGIGWLVRDGRFRGPGIDPLSRRSGARIRLDLHGALAHRTQI